MKLKNEYITEYMRVMAGGNTTTALELMKRFTAVEYRGIFNGVQVFTPEAEALYSNSKFSLEDVRVQIVDETTGAVTCASNLTLTDLNENFYFQYPINYTVEKTVDDEIYVDTSNLLL